MVNLCCNIKHNIKEKRNSLYSLCAGGALFVVLYVLTKIFNCSLCPMYNLFGIKCFGCGLTRAFICILEFDFITAIKYNVLSVPLFVGIVVYIGLLLVDILAGKNFTKTVDKFLSKKYMFVFYGLILIISSVLNYYL